MKCPYRADKECMRQDGDDRTDICNACMLGQQTDELSLLNSAISNMTASIEERLCTDKKTNPSNIVICSPREPDERCNACKHSKPHDFILEQCDEVCFFSGKECMKERLCREE